MPEPIEESVEVTLTSRTKAEPLFSGRAYVSVLSWRRDTETGRYFTTVHLAAGAQQDEEELAVGQAITIDYRSYNGGHSSIPTRYDRVRARLLEMTPANEEEFTARFLVRHLPKALYDD